MQVFMYYKRLVRYHQDVISNYSLTVTFTVFFHVFNYILIYFARTPKNVQLYGY